MEHESQLTQPHLLLMFVYQQIEVVVLGIVFKDSLSRRQPCAVEKALGFFLKACALVVLPVLPLLLLLSLAALNWQSSAAGRLDHT